MRQSDRDRGGDWEPAAGLTRPILLRNTTPASARGKRRPEGTGEEIAALSNPLSPVRRFLAEHLRLPRHIQRQQQTEGEAVGEDALLLLRS